MSSDLPPQVTMDYVLVVLGRCLQMIVSFSILKKDPDRVVSLFSDFNEQIGKLREVFQDVTKEVFKPGNVIVLAKLMGEVKPYIVDENLCLNVSEKDRAVLNRFLQKNNLEVLQKICIDQGIVLTDFYDMDFEEMKSVGITAHSVRKQLMEAVEAHKLSKAPGW